MNAGKELVTVWNIPLNVIFNKLALLTHDYDDHVYVGQYLKP